MIEKINRKKFINLYREAKRKRGTERLLEGLKWCDQPKIDGHDGPTVWAIHMISPSAYDEKRYRNLLENLKLNNVGIIVCPSAAISMRQLRPLNAPTHNSIARVSELIKAKVPLRIGTDNICDLFVPQADGNMMNELRLLGLSVRFNAPSVLAKLATGEKLNNVDVASVGSVLYQDRRVFAGIDENWQAAIE